MKRSLFATALPLAVMALQAQGKPLNVLVVISDDQSTPHLGCYGDRDIKTPNIDRFAAEGMIFTRAYVTCPQSAPSRSSILTGRSPVANMSTRFTAPLDKSITIYPQYLMKEKGYYAGVCGRSHHLDGAKGGANSAVGQTFDEFHLQTMSSRLDYCKIAGQPPEGGETLQMEQFYDFMKTRDKSKPFYLQLCYSDPHRPYTAPKVHDPATLTLPVQYPDTKLVREDFAAYYDEIHRMDIAFGQTMDWLDRNGLKDNTLVIFLGDNGAAQFHGKGTLYEFGINVPLVVRWPGVVKPGSRCDEIISTEDLAPTVLEACGVKPKPDMTGISFISILKGNPAPTRQYAFAERGPHGRSAPSEYNNGFDQSRVVVGKQYKLIWNAMITLRFLPVDFSHTPMFKELQQMAASGKLDPKFRELYFYDHPRPLVELYDIQKDPGEMKNLAYDPAYMKIKDGLIRVLTRWMILERDYLPLPDTQIGKITPGSRDDEEEKDL